MPPRRSLARAGRFSVRAFMAIAGFVALDIVATVASRVPIWVSILYAVMSVVCAAAYVVDKSAALQGARRVPEATLIVLGVLCGWPGAIVAQQWMRHKTAKRSFQSAFRTSVVVNVVGFAAFALPWTHVPRFGA